MGYNNAANIEALKKVITDTDSPAKITFLESDRGKKVWGVGVAYCRETSRHCGSPPPLRRRSPVRKSEALRAIQAIGLWGVEFAA
jgi:hypothetical protein